MVQEMAEVFISYGLGHRTAGNDIFMTIYRILNQEMRSYSFLFIGFRKWKRSLL
jgi:hypothetical protein